MRHIVYLFHDGEEYKQCASPSMRKDLPKNSKTLFGKVENTARGC
jgi:hypothetical protein